VVEMIDEHDHLAKVEVAGVRRTINIGLLEEEGVGTGDWVLIHVGFAMSKINEQEAQLALEGLQLMGRAYDDEIQAVTESRIESRPQPTLDVQSTGG
jgi:hydrogenase expression/formation protein HypC